MEGHGIIVDYSVRPSPSPFPLDFGFWIWDLNFGPGFWTWISDLYLGLDLGLTILNLCFKLTEIRIFKNNVMF